jgi:Mrp family chromosome partitioning ATPase
MCSPIDLLRVYVRTYACVCVCVSPLLQDAAVLRGPLASKVLTQLLMSTEWGELDYLLLDMPPGTGDLQITVRWVLVATPRALGVSI